MNTRKQWDKRIEKDLKNYIKNFFKTNKLLAPPELIRQMKKNCLERIDEMDYNFNTYEGIKHTLEQTASEMIMATLKFYDYEDANVLHVNSLIRD